jgi:hypothetical protein
MVGFRSAKATSFWGAKADKLGHCLAALFDKSRGLELLLQGWEASAQLRATPIERTDLRGGELEGRHEED